MGEVYRATDTRLGREVALKLLPETFAADDERRTRFEREARLLAALNHPNIATLYGLEPLDGHHALVMELVEGEGLDERIGRGAIPADEVTEIAGQIAAALAAAHDQGILHRDLKPANIRVRPDGTVKVLDFGLAKAWQEEPKEGELGLSPTLTSHGTVDGLILGTAGYMSPEQARGRPLDRRSDLWSFGVVVWEMLTGAPLFEGDTVTDLLAGVLRAEIDVAALPAGTPPALRHLVARCLERDPKRRWRDAGDLALELADPARAIAGVGGETGEIAPAAMGARSARAWLAALLAGVVLGAGALWLALRVAPRGGQERERLWYEPKTFGQQIVYNARFLPDGERIVYSAALAGNQPELFLLPAGAMAAQKIAPTGTHLLSVSKSGELAVLTDATYQGHRFFEGTLAKMAIDGAPRALIEGVHDADWGPNGELAIVRRSSGLDRLEYPVGKVLYETSGYISEPRVSVDGSRVAFLDHPIWIDDRGWLKVVDLAGHATRLSDEYWAIEGLSWEPGGLRLRFSGSNSVDRGLQVQPLSAALTGGEVRREEGAPGQFMPVDFAPDGRWLAIREEIFYGVAARPPGSDSDVDLSWLDSSWGAYLSPDSRSILFTDGHGSANYAAVTRRLDGSPITTLGEGGARGFSPDGKWAAAQIATPPELVLYPLGAGTPRHLERGPIEKYETARWFPDGRSLLVVGSEPGKGIRTYRQPVDGGPPEPLVPEGIVGSLSPDGKSLLALENDSTWKLYPLDGGPPRDVPGLTSLDAVAAWSPDGAAVFVHRPGRVPMRLERVEIDTGTRTESAVIGPTNEVGLVRVLLADGVFDPGRGYAYEYLRRLSTLYLVSPAR